MKQNRSREKRQTRDPDAIAFARLQRATANEFANTFWQMLRGRRCRRQKFRREYPIPPYTVDFCCVALKLIVEVDGEHHFTDEGKLHDQRRDTFLGSLGYDVVRIAGYDVIRDLAAVMAKIEAAIDARENPSPPAPLP